MAQVYNTFFFFEIKIDIPTNGGQGNPSCRKKNSENVLYLYRRTGRKHSGLYGPHAETGARKYIPGIRKGIQSRNLSSVLKGLDHRVDT